MHLDTSTQWETWRGLVGMLPAGIKPFRHIADQILYLFPINIVCFSILTLKYSYAPQHKGVLQMLGLFPVVGSEGCSYD